jgi:heme-degrading monooxygenase HmoA
MIAREWKGRCPKKHAEGFIKYLYKTGIKDTSKTEGFLGAQIFNREVNNKVEIKLITYWVDYDSIKTFAGEKIEKAKLYPKDAKYKVKPDYKVSHYKVEENYWI